MSREQSSAANIISSPRAGSFMGTFSSSYVRCRRNLAVFLKVILTAVLAWWLPPSAVKAADDEADLRLIREADAAARLNLYSGRGKAVYEYHRQGPEDNALQLHTKGKVAVAFDGRKYRLEFDYEKAPSRLTSKVILTDGTALFTNNVTPIIKPHGAEVEINAFDRNGDTTPHRAGFPFHPVKFATGPLDLESLLKDRDSLDIERLPDGSRLLKVKKGAVLALVTATPRDGMHITSFQFFENDGGFLAQDCQIKWEKSGDVWYVKSFSIDLNDESDGSKKRRVFAYDTFEPNAEVPPATFTFAALKLPVGARVLDSRPDANPRVYFNYPKQETDLKQIEPLLEHLNKLTKSVDDDSPPEPSRSSWWQGAGSLWWRIGLAGVGLSVSAAGLVLLWRRWAKTQSFHAR